MEYTRIPDGTWNQIQINAGLIASSFTPASGTISGIMGATDGGFSVSLNPEYEDFGEDIDNVPPNSKQLKRIKSYDPTVSATFKTVTEALLVDMIGAADVDAQSGAIIPRMTLTDADFKDVWVVGDYGNSGGFVAVHIKNALNTAGFSWQTTKDGKGAFSVEFHGHYDLEDMDDVPFEAYVSSGS